MAPSKAHAPLLQQNNVERSGGGGGGERDRTYIGTSAPTTASSAHPLFVTISVPPCMHPSTTTKYDPPTSSPSKYSVAGNVKLIIYIHGNSTEIKYKDAPWRYPQ